jgi:hypothetical protein
MNKKNMKLIMGLVLVGGVVATGFINVAPRKPKPIGNPCVLLEKACKDGGIDPNFVFRDCLEHVLGGHDVPGVSMAGISSGQIDNCRSFKNMQRGR